MEYYNLFKLYVVKNDDIYYICEKLNEKYIDIFFREEIDNKNDINHLASYYMEETMQKLSRGEEFILTKKDLLIKFASLNSLNMYNEILELSYNQDIYLNLLKELNAKSVDNANLIVDENIKKLNFK